MLKLIWTIKINAVCIDNDRNYEYMYIMKCTHNDATSMIIHQ